MADSPSDGPLRELFEVAENTKDAQERLYVAMRDGGYLPKAVLQRYICKKKGCTLAVVYEVEGAIYCATEDYKYSPGKNAAKSVEAARANNTLYGGKGGRHWPGHVFDVRGLARSGDLANMSVVCRHRDTTLLASDVLTRVKGVTPGHPIAPVLL